MPTSSANSTGNFRGKLHEKSATANDSLDNDRNICGKPQRKSCENTNEKFVSIEDSWKMNSSEESTTTTDSGGRDRQDTVVLETLNLELDRETTGGVVDEEIQESSTEDEKQLCSAFQECQRHSDNNDKSVPLSRRDRRSYSLDHSNPRKKGTR